jgi:hypothetical protein
MTTSISAVWHATAILDFNALFLKRIIVALCFTVNMWE